MYVKEIWRYPVKSMRGQRISPVDVLRSGLMNDRRIVVASDNSGRLITARTHPALLGFDATLTDDGNVTVNGLAWDSRAAKDLVSEAVSESVSLVDLKARLDRFDILPLLVATDGAIADLGIDGRRLRPNIVLGGVPGREERNWPGRSLRLGPVVIKAAQLRRRCVMTTFDPDTLEQDRSVLRRIVQEMQGSMALDCSVTEPGRLHEGDTVQLLD